MKSEIKAPINYKSNNIRLRFFSGVILGSIYLFSLVFFPKLLFILVVMIAIGMLYEWHDITSSSLPHLLSGLIIIPIAITSLLLIFNVKDNLWLIIIYSAIIVSVDIFAMFGGKFFGGPKLAPVVSPNKTISGLTCGVIAACIVTVLISMIPGFHLPNNFHINRVTLIFFAAIFGLLSQCGDLLKSAYKRRFGFKDSGTIIPGHGGILDRFDGILLTAPTLATILYLLS